MEIEKIEGKFQSELKWGSYFIISSFILSIIFNFFQALIFNQKINTFFILLILNVLIFFFFSFKCIQEIKHKKSISFFLSLGITFKIFVITYILNSLLITEKSPWSTQIILQKNELEIQKVEEDLSDPKSNLLKDFISFLKINI